MKRVHPLLLGLASGALMAAAYRVPGFWPLMFVALVPLLYGMSEIRRTRTIFLSGALAGLCIAGTGTSWFFATLPLPPVFGVTSLWAGVLFVFTNWFFVVLVTGPWVGVWALAFSRLEMIKTLDLCAAAVLFVGAEYCRMSTFNLLTVAPGIANPLFFSAGFVGYPLADNQSFSQLAIFGGVYTLSFVAVFVNLLVFRFFRFGTSVRFAVLKSALLFFALLCFSVLPMASLRAHFAPSPTRHISIGLISLNSPSRTSGMNFDAQDAEARSLAESALVAGADLVVLPEDSRLLVPFSATTYSSLTDRKDAIVIDSGAFTNERGKQVIRSFAHRATGVTYLRDKVILTPDGEYLTDAFKIILIALGAHAQADAFTLEHEYTNGIDAYPLQIAGIRASVLFCLEVLQPGIARNLAAEQGSQLLLIPSSHAWFGNSPSLERDVFRFNRLQAIEAEMPAVVSNDGATSYILDRYGTIVAETGDGSSAETVFSLALP